MARRRGSDGTIYALGGNNRESTQLDTVEAYHPLGGMNPIWNPIAPMPTARRNLAAAASGARIFDRGAWRFRHLAHGGVLHAIAGMGAPRRSVQELPAVAPR